MCANPVIHSTNTAAPTFCRTQRKNSWLGTVEGEGVREVATKLMASCREQRVTSTLFKRQQQIKSLLGDLVLMGLVFKSQKG